LTKSEENLSPRWFYENKGQLSDSVKGIVGAAVRSGMSLL
jgi:hypothetical protein